MKGGAAVPSHKRAFSKDRDLAASAGQKGGEATRTIGRTKISRIFRRQGRWAVVESTDGAPWPSSEREQDRRTQAKFLTTNSDGSSTWFPHGLLPDRQRGRKRGHDRHKELVKIAQESPEHKVLYDAFHTHVFSGPGHGVNKQPRPIRPVPASWES